MTKRNTYLHYRIIKLDNIIRIITFNNYNNTSCELDLVRSQKISTKLSMMFNLLVNISYIPTWAIHMYI